MQREFDAPQLPVLLTDAEVYFEDMSEWRVESLIARYQNTEFKVVKQHSNGLHMCQPQTLREYVQYSQCNSDSEAWWVHRAAPQTVLIVQGRYLFEESLPADLRRSFSTPAYFSQDYFGALATTPYWKNEWLVVRTPSN